jgi:hypothetical protein
MKGRERRTHPLETFVSEVFCRDNIHQNPNTDEYIRSLRENANVEARGEAYSLCDG